MRKRVPNLCVDSDEPLIGVVVLLFNYRGHLVGQTVTDNDGYYIFLGLPLGRYSVSVQCDNMSVFSSFKASKLYALPDGLPSCDPQHALL